MGVSHFLSLEAISVFSEPLKTDRSEEILFDGDLAQYPALAEATTNAKARLWLELWWSASEAGRRLPAPFRQSSKPSLKSVLEDFHHDKCRDECPECP
jgi:hypothetical protein